MVDRNKTFWGLL